MEQTGSTNSPNDFFGKYMYDDVSQLEQYPVQYRHSPELWLEAFKEASHRRKTLKDSVSRQRLYALQRIILYGTMHACHNFQYENTKGEVVPLPKEDLLCASENTYQYDGCDMETIESILKQDGTTMASDSVGCLKGKGTYKVLNGDCIEAAMQVKEIHPKDHVAILNMANAMQAGGGYLAGCGAQEENLHRRTNLFQCLDDPFGFNKNRKISYPLGFYGGLFTKDALVFRGSQDKGYPFLQKPMKLSFVSVAALNAPQTYPCSQTKQIRYTEDAEEKMKGKIRTILNICLKNHVDHVVLSAFGCGAFRNPPRHAAELFKEVIETEGYLKCFKSILFSILEDHNSFKLHNTEGNLKPFAEVFQVEPSLIGHDRSFL